MMFFEREEDSLRDRFNEVTKDENCSSLLRSVRRLGWTRISIVRPCSPESNFRARFDGSQWTG